MNEIMINAERKAVSGNRGRSLTERPLIKAAAQYVRDITWLRHESLEPSVRQRLLRKPGPLVVCARAWF